MKKLIRTICVIPIGFLTLCILLLLPISWAFNKYTFVSVCKDNPVTNVIKSI